MKTILGILATLVVLFGLTGMASAAETVNANMDVNNGMVTIIATTYDHSTWHPGSAGGQETLTGVGSFTGTYKVSEGNYGALYGQVNLGDKGAGAIFTLSGTIDFDVTSANHNRGTYTNYYFEANGNNAAMNLKTVGSMYVWSEATNPYWQPPLQGNYIEKYVESIKKSDSSTIGLTNIWVGTDGTATMSNSNIWGFGANENGKVTSHYGGSGNTRTVTASGTGRYYQEAYGVNGVTFNGFTFGPGSNPIMTAPFSGGMSGNYEMTGW